MDSRDKWMIRTSSQIDVSNLNIFDLPLKATHQTNAGFHTSVQNNM